MSRASTLGFTAFALLVIGLAPPLARPAGAFQTETVVSTDESGRSPSIALDSAGFPRIAYRYWDFDQLNTNYRLKYAEKSHAGVWSIETVTSTPMYDPPSLALDSSGNPCIAYIGEAVLNNGDLMYAKKSGGSWTIETVDATSADVTEPSIALDSSGNPRIAYWDATNGDLKFAEKSGSTWTITTVDATGNVGSACSLALDSSGNPRIAYHSITSGTLKYAFRSGGTWTIETVDATGTTGLNTSLAVDGSGNTCVSYTRSDVATVRFGKRVSGTWTLETVESGNSVGYYETSLALTSAGEPRITYDKSVSHTILAGKYGGTWSTTDLGANLLYSSIKINTYGEESIAFYDSYNKDLLYGDAAMHLLGPSPGHWHAGKAQTVNWYGAGAATIQVNPYESYANSTTLASGVTGNQADVTMPSTWATTYATLLVTRADGSGGSTNYPYSTIVPNPTAAWSVSTVDGSGGANVGATKSLVLDANDEPLIAYADATNGRLRFADGSSASWAFQTIDATGGSNPSCKLDGSGRPCVSYSNGGLKYATRASGTWSIETAASGTIGATALALDGSGNPRILFIDTASRQVKLASKNSGTWTTEVIEGPAGGADTYAYCDLRLDGSGNPRAVYVYDPDILTQKVRYAAKSSGTWATEYIDTSTPFTSYPSLVLSSSGTPCVSYYRGNNYGNAVTDADLIYATKSGSSWTLTTVDAGPGYVGQGTSLQLSGSGEPRVAYAGNGVLKYAKSTSGAWSIDVADTTGSAPSLTSLALSSAGNPRIAYTDQTNADLKYAAAPADDRAPNAVTDLLSTTIDCTNIQITWTAPGDDGSAGTAASYDLRWSSSPITSGNFGSATSLSTGTPHVAGTVESYTVDFGQCARVYVALKSTDDAGNVSGLSNLPHYSGTFCPPPDCFPEIRIENEQDWVTRLDPPAPNPASGPMKLRFVRSRRDAALPVECGIFDLTGRRIRTIAIAGGHAGPVDAQWDLRSERGERVHGGVYFIRTACAGQSWRRTVIVR